MRPSRFLWWQRTLGAVLPVVTKVDPSREWPHTQKCVWARIASVRPPEVVCMKVGARRECGVREYTISFEERRSVTNSYAAHAPYAIGTAFTYMYVVYV